MRSMVCMAQWQDVQKKDGTPSQSTKEDLNWSWFKTVPSHDLWPREKRHYTLREGGQHIHTHTHTYWGGKTSTRSSLRHTKPHSRLSIICRMKSCTTVLSGSFFISLTHEVNLCSPTSKLRPFIFRVSRKKDNAAFHTWQQQECQNVNKK